MRSYHKHKRKKWQWFQLKCYIRGYLYTKRSGTQAGKVAIAVREGENSHDHHAVAISEEDTYCTFKHLLWEISKECFFLLETNSWTIHPPHVHLTLFMWWQVFSGLSQILLLFYYYTEHWPKKNKKIKKWGRPGKVSNKLVNIKMLFHI